MHSLWSLIKLACRFSPFVVVASWAKPVEAAKIACVGDSITYGYGLSNPSQQSWPAVLQTLLGSPHTVQNFGSSGCTLLKLGDKPYWDDAAFSASDAFKPEVVVVMLGTNDAKPQNWSHKADFASDYNSMIQHYRALGALVYVAVPSPVYPPGAFSISPDVLSGEVVPLIRQVAADANAPRIDVFQALSDRASDFPDSVHPNVEGSKLIAQAIAAALQKGGFGGVAGSTGTGGAFGGTSGAAGSTKATGGASTGTGGTSGAGGSTKATGGVSTGTGGTSGVGGSTKAMGGASTGTGGSLSFGGTTGTGAISTGIGGGFNAVGGATTGGTSIGANGGSTVGGQAATGGASAEVGQSGGAGGVGGSNNATSVASTATGGNPVGSSEPTVNEPANRGGCGCRSIGGGPVHSHVVLVTMMLLTTLTRRRRNAPEVRDVQCR